MMQFIEKKDKLNQRRKIYLYFILVLFFFASSAAMVKSSYTGWLIKKSTPKSLLAQGKVLPREKFYPEKKSTPKKVYPEKNPQFWSNQADIGET